MIRNRSRICSGFSRISGICFTNIWNRSQSIFCSFHSTGQVEIVQIELMMQPEQQPHSQPQPQSQSQPQPQSQTTGPKPVRRKRKTRDPTSDELELKEYIRNISRPLLRQLRLPRQLPRHPWLLRRQQLWKK